MFMSTMLEVSGDQEKENRFDGKLKISTLRWYEIYGVEQRQMQLLLNDTDNHFWTDHGAVGHKA